MPLFSDGLDGLNQRDDVDEAGNVIRKQEPDARDYAPSRRSRAVSMSMLPDKPLGDYDDLLGFVFTDIMYNGLFGLFTLFSKNVLVFVRNRLGRRFLRGTTFPIFVILILSLSGYASFSSGFHNVDMPLLLYGFLMIVLAIYHYNIGKEATETNDPRLMLHTRSRGDSHLYPILKLILPRFSIPMLHFTTMRLHAVQIFPLDESAVQRIAEPLFLGIVGTFFTAQGSLLGGWLGLSAICLALAEHHFYFRSLDNNLDMFDAQIEARVMQELQTVYSEGAKPKDTKINGISVATASKRMLQLAQRTQQGG